MTTETFHDEKPFKTLSLADFYPSGFSRLSIKVWMLDILVAGFRFANKFFLNYSAQYTRTSCSKRCNIMF